MSQNLYETVTNTIIDALARGVVPWRKPWHVTNSSPCNAITNRAYRGVNVLLLGLSSHTDHRWLTFKQAQELGGNIKKGEHSTMVVFWKQWEPPESHAEAPTQQCRRVPILRYFNVFNVEQCEGLSLAPRYEPPPLNANERIERADVLVQSMLNPPTIQEGGQAAWYKPSQDLVQVPNLVTFDSIDAFYATLFHELGHATGHPSRLNRPGINGEIQFGSGLYSREELVAELTSAFCCATVSLDNSLTDHAAAYIQSWLEVLKADSKAIVMAAAQAQKAADYIKGIDYGQRANLASAL